MRQQIVATLAAVLTVAAFVPLAFSAGWSSPANLGALNSPSLDGCPIESPDGLSLYFASDRPGGLGGIDIWLAQRSSPAAAWGPAVNAGGPVNSSADDFCPTPTENGYLYFVSSRAGGCGGADIYRVRMGAAGAWGSYETLGCQVNSAGAEFSPSLVREGSDMVLYFSSARAGGFAPEEGGAAPDHDIYSARMLSDGSFAPPVLVPGVNSAADDARPNVRLDGLELVFDSTRPGGLGGPDIWVASRQGNTGAWSMPTNPGAPINSAAGESRPSLSRDGSRLYFGSTRPGGQGNSDIMVAQR
jgi:Tol biopolymer transport system component